MLNQNFFLTLPERTDTPATKVFVKIMAENEESLKTKPYIFIFPGGPGTNHSHYQDYNCLHTHGNIVFHDPRGCGLSDKNNPIHYTMDNYIDDIEAIRQALKLETIIVLGKSYGAMAALGFVIKYPPAVSKLILSAGVPSFKFLDTARANVLAQGTQEQQQVCEKLWLGHFENTAEVEHFLKVMAPLYSYKIRNGFSPPPSPATTSYPFNHKWLNQGFAGCLRSFNFEDDLQNIGCETLILVGEKDWITDKIYSQYMAQKIPHNKLIIFQNASHKMEFDVQELYFEAIKAFV